MECLGGDMNRMVCGGGGVKLVRWWMDWGLWLVGFGLVGLSWV